VVKWPDRATVEKSLRKWVKGEAEKHPELVRLGFFGSYAGEKWGVGSDIDLVAVVEDSNLPFERRALGWDTNRLPVPADLLVYTIGEWRKMETERGRFIRTLEREVVWVFERQR
jgi:predicted nucleotidyltransferase